LVADFFAAVFVLAVFLLAAFFVLLFFSALFFFAPPVDSSSGLQLPFVNGAFPGTGSKPGQHREPFFAAFFPELLFVSAT
jgi:hypothetical protein